MSARAAAGGPRPWSGVTGRLRSLGGRVWDAFLPRARISTRIVAAVVVTMTGILLAADVFVYWRIAFALDRQLDQDLRAYTSGVAGDLREGRPLPTDKPGEVAQVFGPDGELTAGSDDGVRPLLTPAQVAAADSRSRSVDLGRLLPPPSATPYRVNYLTVQTPDGPRVLAAAISRNKHDEALRELILQLGLAGLAAVLASAAVGWGAVRAALGPVERFRRAAAGAGDASVRLPVDEGRDDELTRLGATFNTLLAEIQDGHARERRFLADASHELRSPLAVLAAEVEWARHRPRSADELARVLESVGDQTRRLASLADGLLTLEEASASQAQPEPVSLADLVDRAVAPASPRLAQAGRTLHTEVVDVVITIDPTWVERVVANLVDNAVTHGRGEVSVRAEVTGEVLSLVVTDAGEGIPAELGARAFERFARADAARTRPGTGLGLAIVAAVADRHGGTALLVPGGVRVELPLPGEAAAAAADPQAGGR